VIRRLVLAGLAGALAACSGCRTTPPPTSPPTASTLAAELVDAGCIVPSATLTASIQIDEQSDAAPAWFRCLVDGGTPRACGVPCGDGGQ